MDLYFVEAKFPLVKTLAKIKKKFEETPYPMAKQFTSHHFEVDSISDFERAIRENALQQRALIKGTLNRSLTLESRAGSTDPYSRTKWICLDLDNFLDEAKLEDLLDQLGLGSTSYVLQYSSKHGITKDFSAHLFFMLEKPVLPEQLKLWLTEANLRIKLLRSRLELTAPATALKWPLDISLAQNDKIIYIAPPRCVGFDDPVEERIKLVVKRDNHIDLTKKVEAVDPNEVAEMKQAAIDELRKAKGLKKRTFATKTAFGSEVLSKPGSVVITGMKEERGFVYFNFNGGDSWGYFHPTDNPEIIRNFKGEPNYLTKDLIPDYYKQVKQQLQDTRPDVEKDEVHFAFLDRRTDRYYRGSFDPSMNDLEIFPTDSVRKVTDFFKQHGIPEPEFIEEWDYLFRPDDERIFVPEERFVNQYRMPEIMQGADTRPVKSIPPTIARVLHSVSGNDKEVLTHLVNWLATIVQLRQRTQTMWVFHGVPGTGKGVLVHEILAPILGQSYVHVKSLSSLEEEYNHYMERCLLLMIDESKRTQVKNEEKVIARLKQAVTDPVIPIRKMRTDPYQSNSYMNIIVASNYPDPIRIEAGDRRINVAPYQTQRLRLDKDDIKKIRSELKDFAAVLAQLNIDVERAKTPLENDARRKLMYLTETSLEGVFGAIRAGDLDFFIEALPTDDKLLSVGATDQLDNQSYISILKEAERHALSGQPHLLTRDQTKLLAQYTLGDMPKTSNRFSALAKHYDVTFSRASKGGKKVQAYRVDWQLGDARVDDFLNTQQLRAVN